MSSQTIRMALADALEDLSKQDFEKFCFFLLSRKQGPRVKRNRVEDRSRLQVVDTLVSTFTESGALKVALEILNQIGCTEEAKSLDEETSGQSSKPGSSDNEHFVDEHRVKLIQRVNNIAVILDELLSGKVIQQESYDKIRALSTSQEKMRELYNCLKAGRASKDIFYNILKKNEPFLVDDLN